MSGLLSKIAANRDERVKDLHLDLPIPTWGGDLVARFGVLPRNEVEAFANKRRNLEADMDFLIKTITALYAHDPERTAEGPRMEENEDYVLVQSEDGRPLKFEQAFGELIGMKVKEGEENIRARSVVMYCFKENSIAIGGFAVKVITWMQDTDAQVAERLVGE